MRLSDSLKLDYFQISLACLRRIAFRRAKGYAQFPVTASSLLIISRSDKFIQNHADIKNVLPYKIRLALIIHYSLENIYLSGVERISMLCIVQFRNL